MNTAYRLRARTYTGGAPNCRSVVSVRAGTVISDAIEGAVPNAVPNAAGEALPAAPERHGGMGIVAVCIRTDGRLLQRLLFVSTPLRAGLVSARCRGGRSGFQFLTFVVSLEAIFLSTFVMIGQNRQAAFQQAKADHDFHEAETELRLNTQLTRTIYTMTQEIHAATEETRQKMGGEDASRGGS